MANFDQILYSFTFFIDFSSKKNIHFGVSYVQETSIEEIIRTPRSKIWNTLKLDLLLA